MPKDEDSYLDELTEIHDKLTREETRLGAMEMIVTINDESVICAVSHAAAKLFGYLTSELLGRHVSILMRPGDVEIHKAGLSEAVSGHRESTIVGGPSRSVVGVRRGGEEFTVELSVNEVTLAGVHYFIGQFKELDT